ncbi:hypothetical protein SAMN04487896_4609 [Paenibacillus sp. ov031]|uniref:hypothetical protein n=1 Tax=Paenibacillus sp. ov031 TaxID=1761879 RepID=UPI00091A94DF|nr:hypothetical protein [Paenibacillus sp. ov031]SHN80814.1 hypothetical protein SAMN04487896_4609 [Paenibacillus sp. ov031]
MARNWSITEEHYNHQVDFIPRFQESYNSIQPVCSHTPDEYALRNTIMGYHQHSKYHIKLATIMHNHNQFQACLILCDWALASMIKALYIQKYHAVHPPKELTMNEILPLVHTDTVPGLDRALFIGMIQHMSTIEGINQDRTIKPNNIKNLLQRTEEILKELENRLE